MKNLSEPFCRQIFPFASKHFLHAVSGVRNAHYHHAGKKVFNGAISVHKTIPNGTVSEVNNEVYTRIKTVGYDGGYMVSNENTFPYDAPLANILAM